jgi:hypothetical protein
MIILTFILVYLVSFAILLIDYYIDNKSQIFYVKDLIDSIKPMVYIWFPIFNTITLIGFVILLVVYKLWKLFRLDILWENFRNIKLR